MITFWNCLVFVAGARWQRHHKDDMAGNIWQALPRPGALSTCNVLLPHTLVMGTREYGPGVSSYHNHRRPTSAIERPPAAS